MVIGLIESLDWVKYWINYTMTIKMYFNNNIDYSQRIIHVLKNNESINSNLQVEVWTHDPKMTVLNTIQSEKGIRLWFTDLEFDTSLVV